VADGSHTILARAYDTSGQSTDSATATVSVSNTVPDTTPPTSTIACNGAACSSSTYSAAVSVTLSAIDNPGGSGVAEIVYTTDGSDPSLTNGTTYSAAFSVASTTTVKYRAYDNAGNAEPVNTALLQVDTTPPTSTIACNGAACGSGYFNAAVSVTLAATDNTGGSGVASIRYTTNGTDPSTTNGTVYSAAFSVAATTTVKYRAYDKVGNAEAVNSQLISIDTIPPTVAVTSPTAGALLSGTVNLTANASDNVAVDHVDFLVDGKVVATATSAPYSVSWNSTSVPDGLHTVTARAVDSAGNSTTSAGVSVNVTNTNLLKNPSLEQATNGVPTCWLLGGSGTNTYTWTYTTDAHTGSHAENLSISAWTSGDRKLVNTQDTGTCAPTISAGHTYTVTAWYKSTVQPYIYVYYRNSSGSWVYWTQSAKLAVAAGWTQASFTTPAVPSGATNISVGMGMSGVGSVTMDDFGLYATS
jgi:archaellum component FlaF (FlaF/FlaG flagellin family)